MGGVQAQGPFSRTRTEFSPNSYRSQSQQSIFKRLLDTSNTTSCWQRPEPLNCPGDGPGWKGSTEVVNSSIPRQDCNFTPNLLVNETGVREENKNRSRPGDVRTPEENMPGKSEMQFVSSARLTCHIQLSHVCGKSPPFLQGFLSSSLMVTVFTSVYSASAYSPLRSRERKKKEENVKWACHLAVAQELHSNNAGCVRTLLGSLQLIPKVNIQWHERTIARLVSPLVSVSNWICNLGLNTKVFVCDAFEIFRRTRVCLSLKDKRDFNKRGEFLGGECSVGREGFRGWMRRGAGEQTLHRVYDC